MVCEQSFVVNFPPAACAHFLVLPAPPLRRPVRLAAMSPTFAPGQAERAAVVGCPTCWWLPPPWGCSTGFMAEPRTFGQELRFTRYLWKLFPALRTGLSMRPPPATMPMTARHVDGTVLREPEGKRSCVLAPQYTNCPVCKPSTAVQSSFRSL